MEPDREPVFVETVRCELHPQELGLSLRFLNECFNGDKFGLV